MENMLLRLLPKEKHHVLVRYVSSAAIIGLAGVVRYSLGGTLQHYPLLLFIPAVFLCALLFDKGSGFFATGLAGLISAYVFMSPSYSFRIGSEDAIAVAIFILVGFTMAAVTEALRKTVDQLSQAEQSKSLLLEELAHRTKNDLAIVGSAITLQARASESDEVRKALETANTRVQVVAAAQARLRGLSDGGEVKLDDYLESLCSGLGDLLRDVRPIAVRVNCPPVQLSSSGAVSVGLIVNELVTNSLKHAFPGDRGGVVHVIIERQASEGLQIRVSDNGVGCAESAGGMGSRLVRLLTQQRGGEFTRLSNSNGCEAVAILPQAA